jgi:hypothetical protein
MSDKLINFFFNMLECQVKEIIRKEELQEIRERGAPRLRWWERIRNSVSCF